MDITEQNINDNNEITANSKQLEILKKNFPNCFDKDGNFIAARMEEIVTGNGLELSKESYSLNWLGKSYARLLANENPLTMLKEDIEHNQKEENKDSQNILIKGDNLEVLKHLKNAYENEIKMIYIDPPYNTGSDGFVYNDDRKFSMEELSQLAGVSLEEAKRILEFTESNSNSHSAWLTFMYPRLYIARELLKDDGVIFISIDESEVAQLRLLCDEVFGEENFSGDIIWKNSSKNDQKYVSMQHEYILTYVKSKSFNKGEWEEKKEGLDEIYKAFESFKKKHNNNWTEIHTEALKWYKQFPDSNPIRNSKHYSWMDDNGVYFPDNISGPNYGQYRYDVIHPVTKQVCKEPSSGWRFPETTMEDRIKNNLVHFGKDHTTVPNNKTYLKNTEFQSLTSIKYKDGRVASKQLKALLGGDCFTNPKDIDLLIAFFKALKIDNNDIVLDFFAGSGSTSHAIMKLNSIENKAIKSISIQIAEPLKKDSKAYIAGYKTIFDITKERIIKASKQIKEEMSKDITKNIDDFDLGFKIYGTSPLLDTPLSKMIKFDDTKPKLFDPSILQRDDFNALLTTWKVHDGAKLTDDLREITFKDYKAYYGDKKLYFVNNGFTTEDLKEFIKMLDDDKTFEPNKLILFGYTFDSKYQREISEALNSYTNKKSIEIDMIVRY